VPIWPRADTLGAAQGQLDDWLKLVLCYCPDNGDIDTFLKITPHVNPEAIEAAQEQLRELQAQQSSSVRDVREKLVAIFTAHNPPKLAVVDQLLKEWAGHELELLGNVESKYLGGGGGAPGASPGSIPEGIPGGGSLQGGGHDFEDDDGDELELGSALVVADYLQPSFDGAVAVRQGEVVTLLDISESDWWFVRTTDGREGAVPASFLMRDEVGNAAAGGGGGGHVAAGGGGEDVDDPRVQELMAMGFGRTNSKTALVVGGSVQAAAGILLEQPGQQPPQPPQPEPAPAAAAAAEEWTLLVERSELVPVAQKIRARVSSLAALEEIVRGQGSLSVPVVLWLVQAGAAAFKVSRLSQLPKLAKVQARKAPAQLSVVVHNGGGSSEPGVLMHSFAAGVDSVAELLNAVETELRLLGLDPNLRLTVWPSGAALRSLEQLAPDAHGKVHLGLEYAQLGGGSAAPSPPSGGGQHGGAGAADVAALAARLSIALAALPATLSDPDMVRTVTSVRDVLVV
jgi:hypothetical protein